MSDVFDIVLRGRIVTEEKVISGEVGVLHGKIAAISEQKGIFQGKQLLDFDNALVFPGFIDVHVHCFSNPEEGFERVSRSAAVGGITTFLDMPYDMPTPIHEVHEFRNKVERLKKEAVVDVGLYATIKKKGGLDQIIPLAEAGAIGFKMSTFETDEYRFPRIPDYELMKAFELIRRTGLRVGLHAENDDLIYPIIEEFLAQKKVYSRAHAESRPPLTETSATLKLLEFAYWTGVNLHIFHVTHPRCIELIQWYKAEGVNVTAETCYNYLLLDIDDLTKYGPLVKINPPLRDRTEVEKMWQLLENNKIEILSSDHAPWQLEKKEIGKDNIFNSASGMPGIEILAPLLFHSAVSQGRLSLLQFARFMSQNPAEVFSIPGKGKIACGYDADFTVIDPDQQTVIDEKAMQSISKWTPYHGRVLQGKIMQTIVRGHIVYDGKDICQSPGFGKFICGKATKSELRSRS